MKYVLLTTIAAVLAATRAAEDPPKIVLGLTAPSASVPRGAPFTLTFRVTNEGHSGLYFKRPWKWASNAMLVTAQGPDNVIVNSETLLFDIPAASRCTYFKPLLPGESYSFTETFTSDPFTPSLALRQTGTYILTWRYETKHYPEEAACASAGWPIWKGTGTASSSISIRQ